MQQVRLPWGLTRSSTIGSRSAISRKTTPSGHSSATLEGIDKGIDDAEAKRRHAIRRSLDKLEDLSQEDEERIESAVNSGRFQVAEDFIERIEHGQELPSLETTGSRPFDRFFPAFAEKYTALRDREGDGIVHAKSVIISRDSDEFIDASGLSEDASRDGIALLDAWMALRDGQTSVSGLRALMSALGFAHAHSAANQPGNTWRRERVCASRGTGRRSRRRPASRFRLACRRKISAIRSPKTQDWRSHYS